MSRIFHIASVADWQAAQRSGSYTTSTRGRTLAEEGFIHASRGDQWPRVREVHYADVGEPLLLLTIETERLDVAVVEEQVAGGTERYPHIYGPLPVEAVVRAEPLPAALAAARRSFSSLFLEELFVHAALGLALLLLAAAGVLVGREVDADRGPWAGLVVGVLLGAGFVVLVARRRRR